MKEDGLCEFLWGSVFENELASDLGLFEAAGAVLRLRKALKAGEVVNSSSCLCPEGVVSIRGGSEHRQRGGDTEAGLKTNASDSSRKTVRLRRTT